MAKIARLEMVFLMNVSLHLETMKDVMEFESINKKCSTSIHSLKVNPWFYFEEDIEKFHKIFTVPTCNCNGNKIEDLILLRVERIRNYLFEGIPEDNFFNGKKNIMINKLLDSIIPKLESFETKQNGSKKEFELLLKNMKPNLKIKCEEKFFIGFELAFRNLKVRPDLYPKQIIIEMNGFNEISHLIHESNQHRIHCIWREDDFKYETENVSIAPKVKNYINFVDLKLLMNNKNVELMIENNDFPVSLEEFAIEEKRIKYLDLIKKVCALRIYIKEEEEEKPILIAEKIKLPECVKEIVDCCFYHLDANIHYNRGLPFSFDGIEILKLSGYFEMNEAKDLKELVLINACRTKIYKQCRIDKKEEWGMKNTIDFFPKLEKLDLCNCRSIKILKKLKNIKYLNIKNSESCDINVDSKNLKDIYLNCESSKFKLKIFRNDIKFIISCCSSVDIEIESEEGIKPNIEITKCQGLKIKSNNEMGNIIMEESNNISFNEGFKSEVIQLNHSETADGLIEANVVRFINVIKTCSINLNKAKEIIIANTNKYISECVFESCKKLIIYECNECDFDLGNNQIEEMKVMKCKSINIEGKIPNIKAFVSIENIECKLPITDTLKTTDEEIIELKENTKIVTDKKHLIIRNGKDVNCEIESLIKTDITFENCHNIGVTLKNKIIGSEFNKHKSFMRDSKSYGCIDSLIVNNSKNLRIKVESVNKFLKLENSDLYLKCGIDVDSVEIENSNLESQKNISSKKCVIINSKTDLDKIVNYCEEELVLKGKEGGNFRIYKKVKKITFEDCSNLQCNGDLKGKEVLLIKCSDMKLRDTSNSIKMESCQNVEVSTENNIGQNFSGIGGFGQPIIVQNHPAIIQQLPRDPLQPMRNINNQSVLFIKNNTLLGRGRQPTILQPQTFVNIIQQPYGPIQPTRGNNELYFKFTPKNIQRLTVNSPPTIGRDSFRTEQDSNDGREDFFLLQTKTNQSSEILRFLPTIRRQEKPPN